MGRDPVTLSRSDGPSPLDASVGRDFAWCTLRTTDVPAARLFYEAVLGPRTLPMAVLPSQAAARGAVPHWLGHLPVGDVEAAAAAFVARGGARLGPTRTGPDGPVAVVRDPGGAVVALVALESSGARTHLARQGVVWCSLMSKDLPRARETYGGLMGWVPGEAVDLGELGTVHRFGVSAGQSMRLSMMDVAGRPEVHAHWLFHFGVPAAAVAVSAVREAGGSVVGLFPLPDGAQVAVCEDPQGAAFALRQPPPAR